MRYEFEIITEATIVCDHTVEVEAKTEEEARLLAREEALRCARNGRGTFIYACATINRLKGAPCPKN